ncbi:MAG: metal-dependent hydrolase [Sulfurovum sp.]|nr:metal-dependent hydrolase [Sulfurovum sp.]
MNIIHADYIYTPQGFVANRAVAFTDTIIAIDSVEVLQEQYPEALLIQSPPHTILYPGFINTHVHLEFSANKTSLRYGDFMPWLDSVIEKREDLVGACDNEMMGKECHNMLRSGITSFGAVSSFGNEFEVCEQSPQRVVFYNELIGSNALYADILYADFMERVKMSMSCPKSSRISPAIAIHSPYAVHPILLQKAVNLAKKHQMPLSAHFLESKAERTWLESSQGEFKAFFEKYFKSSIAVTNIEEFMYAFDTYPTHFVHAVHAQESELDYLASKGHSIAHCPRSNRYLGCGKLAIENLKLPYTIATDGLSSNDSLNMFDELRATLMMHDSLPIEALALTLIDAITAKASDILGLDCGRIAVGKLADFALVTLDEAPQRTEALALWTILHTQEVSAVYIAGESSL